MVKGLVGLVAVFVLFFVMTPAFAQTSDHGEQTTLSGDLQNNPLAQEILDKIEQTRQWIAELEERNYEKIQNPIELELKKLEIKKIYDKKYDDTFEQSKVDEKNVTLQYNQDPDMTKEESSVKILQIRNDYEDEKEDILKDKIKEIKLVKNQHKQEIMDLVELYESDPYVEIVLDSRKINYQAVLRE